MLLFCPVAPQYPTYICFFAQYPATNVHKFPFLEFSPSFISFQLSSSPCGVPAIDRECLADHEACARTAQPKNGNLCHPPGERRYIHIDSLFSTQVEWDLIETMLPDMLRVALSINVTHVAARQSDVGVPHPLRRLRRHRLLSRG
jgi:hypothetical protein